VEDEAKVSKITGMNFNCAAKTCSWWVAFDADYWYRCWSIKAYLYNNALCKACMEADRLKILCAGMDLPVTLLLVP
jgi:hypothetical protein